MPQRRRLNACGPACATLNRRLDSGAIQRRPTERGRRVAAANVIGWVIDSNLHLQVVLML